MIKTKIRSKNTWKGGAAICHWTPVDISVTLGTRAKKHKMIKAAAPNVYFCEPLKLPLIILTEKLLIPFSQEH